MKLVIFDVGVVVFVYKVHTSLITNVSGWVQLFSCQGTVLEESLGRPAGEKGRSPGVREALEYVCPQLSLSCLRLGQPGPHTEEALARLDELGIHNKFKVRVTGREGCNFSQHIVL